MNAPAQPVPPVSNPATFFASRVLPDQIAEALIEAREKCGVQKRKDEDGHAYFDAVDVVPEVGKVFRDVGLSLFAPNFQIRSVGTWLVLQRAGCLRHDKGSQFPITAEWLIDLGGLPPGPAMNAALTQSTSGLYRVCMDLVKDETKAKRDPALTASDAERSDNSTQRSHKPAGKKHTAKQTGAWAEANGIKPAEDVSEKDEREAREELARVEAEAKANADPRFKDEKPIDDPPGLMEDEPSEAEKVRKATESMLAVDLTVPPAPAETFDQPASGNSDTSSEGACKGAPEATPQAPESVSGATSNSGPNFLDQGEWAGVKSESSAGGESSPLLSSPPAPGPLVCATCGIAMPCDPCEHECRPRDGGSLLQPSPALLSAVDGLLSKGPPVLVKRSAEGRASKWAKAIKRAARKPALCAECHGQIKAKEDHWDGGSKRCCLACRERLESEAAGAGKESAA